MRRRGLGLIHLVGGMFVSGVVLGLCVPLYVSAQRHAEAGVARARMAEQARRLTGHLREDVRQATTVRVLRGGSALALELGGGAPVVYQPVPGGLSRTQRPSGGRPAEQEVFGAPLSLVRFERSGSAVRTQLFFEQPVGGRRLAFSTDCLTTPRAQEATR